MTGQKWTWTGGTTASPTTRFRSGCPVSTSTAHPPRPASHTCAAATSTATQFPRTDRRICGSSTPPRRGSPGTATATGRRFPDVRTTTPGHELDVITGALAGCRQSPPMSAPQGVPGRRWSGWPHTPGVGPAVLSLYHWAVHHDTTRHDTTGHGTAAGHHGTAGHGIVGPQLLDQQAVASLIHLGWVGNPVAARFTWVQYTRYCHLLHAWATQGDVTAELIEMWLVTRWRDRTTHRSDHTDQQHR